MFCIGYYARNAINLACNIALSKKYYTFSIFMLNHLFLMVYGSIARLLRQVLGSILKNLD